MYSVSDGRANLYRNPSIATAYKSLENRQVAVAQESCGLHQVELELWCQFLSLMTDGLDGPVELSTFGPGTDERQKLLLQLQILGSSIQSMKSALDLLVDGSYYAAFGSIRNLIESYLHIGYLELRPYSAWNWYQRADAESDAQKPLRVWEIVQALKNDPPFGLEGQIFEKAYQSWRWMCKGAHPSGEGIVLTSAGDGNYSFGATYNRTFFYDGVSNGFFAMRWLLICLHTLKPQEDSWGHQFAGLVNLVHEWTMKVLSEKNCD